MRQNCFLHFKCFNFRYLKVEFIGDAAQRLWKLKADLALWCAARQQLLYLYLYFELYLINPAMKMELFGPFLEPDTGERRLD